MNLLMGFCLYMALIYEPWDFFFKPVAEDREVLFGLLLAGWKAKAVEPLHWAIYAAGAYGFWHMRPWMWPWAAVYVAQIAGSMLVWAALAAPWPHSVWAAPLVAVPFAALSVVLWNARDWFRGARLSAYERYGGWALVTGASSGIGREFARALASQGASCVLVARRADELERLASELRERYRVEARTVAADLTSDDGVTAVFAAIDGLDVGIVVNNAGAGYVGRLELQEESRLAELVRLNCLAPLRVARRLIPGLSARGRGAIVFTGSVAGRTPLPLHTTYSATKAFTEFLGKGLWAELRGRGIDVLVVEPGPVETGFQRVSGEVLQGAAVAPTAVVATALDALGRQPSVVHGLGLAVGSYFARLLPASLVLHLTLDQTTRLTPREMR
jgi:short-subunit dehydrogenase